MGDKKIQFYDCLTIAWQIVSKINHTIVSKNIYYV